MSTLARVELQAEVGRRRESLFGLVSTADGLRRWLDAAELEPVVGGAFRFGMAEAVAHGTVVALGPPQHISFEWDWEGEPLPGASVVAFDLIDHGRRTHLTVRHVGLRREADRRVHEGVWRYWFARLVRAAETDPLEPADAPPTEPPA